MSVCTMLRFVAGILPTGLLMNVIMAVFIVTIFASLIVITMTSMFSGNLHKTDLCRRNIL